MKDALDFIVIGAQKAGTTSLFEYLRQHPELTLPAGKEAPFFSHERAYARGWDDYLRKAFSLADPDTKWGTATPQYMVGGLWEQPNPVAGETAYDEHTVPRRIRERLPDARLIAILRDPAERALSHHRMAVMNEIETRPFAQAVDELLRPEALEQARREPREVTGYVAWGEYGRLLTGYFETFSEGQILVTFTEDLERDPEGLLRRVYGFLGVRSDFTPENIGARYRVGATERRLSWLGTDSRLNPWTLQRALTGSTAAKGLWHALPEPARRRIDRGFGRISYKMDLWNRRTKVDSSEADRTTLERLRAHYEHDARKLATLLGTDPPWQR